MLRDPLARLGGVRGRVRVKVRVRVRVGAVGSGVITGIGP